MALTAAEPVKEFFAPAQFFDMDDGKKLWSAGRRSVRVRMTRFGSADGRNADAASPGVNPSIRDRRLGVKEGRVGRGRARFGEGVVDGRGRHVA